MSGATEPAALGEGDCWEGDDPRQRAVAIEAAFDYRGDVTIFLDDGAEVEGYVFNRSAEGEEPFLQILEAGASSPRRIAFGAVRGLAFTGKDTASGKSWESWVRKHGNKHGNKQSTGEAAS